MISIDLMGGLGNQLFMLFATFAYGIQHNQKVVLPIHNGTPNRGTYWENLFSHLTMFTTMHPENQYNIHEFTQYKEPCFSYRPLPDFGHQNTLLYGYYQSPKYFEPHQKTIFQLMHLSDQIKGIRIKYSALISSNEPLHPSESKDSLHPSESKDSFNQSESKDSLHPSESKDSFNQSESKDSLHPSESKDSLQIVSMHFRLGDYKFKRYYHPIMNYEYFEEALRYTLEKRQNIKRVLYLCEKNDNDYVGRQIAKLQATFPHLEYVKVPDNVPDYDQLLIMACCQHNIMSNSTFSWWGAYMNEHSNKLVCYPSVWFGQYFEHTHDSKDMMPEDWVQIEANPIHYKQPLE